MLIWYVSSPIVYPVPGREQLPTEDPRLQSGKYEPLVHMNAVLSEEVQRVMGTLAGKRIT